MKRKLKSGEIVTIDAKLPELNALAKIIATCENAMISLTSNDIPVLSTRNIVGELAEIRCCELLNLTQEIPSNAKYDATDEFNNKYQIKARINSGSYSSVQFGDIAETSLDSIDYVIITSFNSEDFSTEYMYKISRNVYKVLASKTSKNAYRLLATGSVLKKINDLIDGKNIVKII